MERKGPKDVYTFDRLNVAHRFTTKKVNGYWELVAIYRRATGLRKWSLIGKSANKSLAWPDIVC